MNQKHILVVGGGISGITSAIEIAEVGHKVTLIEKLPYLGGKVAQVNQYFPKLCPPYCGLEINFKRIRQNPRISFHVNSVVEKVSGSKGNFTVNISKLPEYVNNNCTSCGDCVNVCPQERPNDFNLGFNKTKAIYLPHEMAFPWKYSIDDNYCKKTACNKCVEVCKYNAIDLNADDNTIELNVHSIVYATGWDSYDPMKLNTYGYNKFKNVITNAEFERLAALNGPFNGEFKRLSDEQIPKSIAFVQCAGSRDENHLPYCSGVCCSASLKQALYMNDHYPETKVKIFYIDMRVTGRNEDFLQKVINRENIELIKGKVAQISENKENQNLIVDAEDIMSGRKSKEEIEMLVLATGIVPNTPGTIELKIDEWGFNAAIQEDGVYVTGCAKKPADVSSSVKDATGTALKAIQ